MNRRAFLKTSSAFCLGALIAPETLFAQREDITKSIQFYNINTKEHLDIVYFEGGKYLEYSLKKINAIMRDRRSEEITQMNTRLIDTLHKIQTLSGSNEPIEIICGYRSMGTNAKLTCAKRGVAKHSYHTLGEAADIKIPDVSLAQVRSIAESLNAGGVGYYPGSGFVHIDVGPIRTWGG